MREGPRPDSVSRRTERLVASVIQHHRAISAHHSQLLAAVVELDRRKAWRVDGATSMVAWLVQQCGVAAVTAREWVTAATKLQELPKISDALSQGKLSFDQVKPLVEVWKLSGLPVWFCSSSEICQPSFRRLPLNGSE